MWQSCSGLKMCTFLLPNEQADDFQSSDFWCSCVRFELLPAIASECWGLFCHQFICVLHELCLLVSSLLCRVSNSHFESQHTKELKCWIKTQKIIEILNQNTQKKWNFESKHKIIDILNENHKRIKILNQNTEMNWNDTNVLLIKFSFFAHSF